MEASHKVWAASLRPPLEDLDDAELFALMTQAQGLLLDRPAARGGLPALVVEVVEREEGRLLSAYRALPPDARRRLREDADDLMRLAQLRPRFAAGELAGCK
jgi:hypothetical protein